MEGIFDSIKVMTPDEVELIHKESVRILENTGIAVPNDECLALCRKLGAVVDRQTNIMKIPSGLMENIIDMVRKTSDTGAAGEGTKPRVYGNISTQVFYINYKSGTRRYGVLEDIHNGIAVTDNLKNIRESNAIVVPHDVPYNISDIESHKLIYCYSKRPGGTYILSEKSAGYIIEMAKVINKNLVYGLRTISPLQFRKESLDIGLIFAKQGYDLSLGPMIIGGATGPVTIAGVITMQNVEVLASLFMIYAMTGRCCHHYGGACHSMDLKTMLCSFGLPNQALLGMGIAQMARFYGMKPMSNSGLTDSLMPDYQAGIEKAMNAVFSCMAGCVQIGAQGLVGADQGISLEQLVIDNEWLDAYNYILQGFEVNRETIGADLVEAVGIGGNFVAEEHTVEHMRRNYWSSKLFDRITWDAFLEGGRKTLLDKAHSYIESIVESRCLREPVIDASKLNEINYIVKRARKELAGM